MGTTGISKRVGLVASIGAVSALIAISSVQAHGYRQGSSVSARYGSGAFRGVVRSAEPFCYRWRTVKLREFDGGIYRVVRSDRTNRNGEYRIGYSEPRGAFYVQVTRKVSRSDGHSHICDAVESDYMNLFLR